MSGQIAAKSHTALWSPVYSSCLLYYAPAENRLEKSHMVLCSGWLAIVEGSWAAGVNLKR